MKRLNNKGITTIEVIISFVIVVIITASLYTTVSNYNQKRLIENYKSKIYTYKNTLTKEIQDDFIKIGLTHATYKSEHNNSTIYHIVECDLRDGTKRKLKVTQRFTDSTYHAGNATVDDYFMIEYGNEEAGDLLEYPLPNLGQSLTENNKIAYDLSINNVLINIEDDNVLSIYIGFYHPELMTRYGINIVCPIDFVSKGVDASNKFNVQDVVKLTKKYTFDANAGAGIIPPKAATVGQPFHMPNKGTIIREGYTLTSWNTQSDGSGVKYELGETVVPTANQVGTTTLYAQWEKVNSKSFAYSGSIQTYLVPEDGVYQLEVWGASGGRGCQNGQCNDAYKGGLGGYSRGDIRLTKGTTLYVVVGGQGADATNTSCNGAAGGYNGGGNGGKDSNCDSPNIEPGAGGGGATHIAKVSGLLKDLSGTKNNILIVAGGGGGGAYRGIGGSGGGTSGTPIQSTTDCGSKSATSESGHTVFGAGADGSDCTGGNSGSGGGYFGGISGTCDCPGGGGSGYIYGLQNSDTLDSKNTGNGKATIKFVSD